MTTERAFYIEAKKTCFVSGEVVAASEEEATNKFLMAQDGLPSDWEITEVLPVNQEDLAPQV